eukprot:jgi/Picsp_1/5567/NSC_02926-R1_nicastrin
MVATQPVTQGACRFNIRSGKELKKEIYRKLGQAGDWCVQMQTSTSVVGCAALDHKPLLEGLLLWPAQNIGDRDIKEFTLKDEDKIAAVVQAMDAGPFLEKLIRSGRSMPDDNTDISAILILPSQNSLGSFRWNFADKGPLPKKNDSHEYHEWNPNGLGLLKATFSFPIVQLSKAETELVSNGAELNVLKRSKSSSPLYRIDINYAMEGKNDSFVCIRDRTCLPLGGLSVLSSPVSSAGRLSKLSSPVILVTARMDSNGPFHNLLRGFNDPRSGLVAMLVAARAVGQLTHLLSRTESLEKRVIFAAIQGDAFDLMGSRRLLIELHRDKSLQDWFDIIQSDQPLEAVDAIIDIGPIARALQQGDKYQIYAHRNPKERSQGRLSSSIIEMMTEFCGSVSSRTSLSLDPLQNLSPTEQSFAQARADLPIISISEYSEEFLNNGSLSQFGDYRTDGMMSEEFNIDIIADFATVLAHTLLQISFPSARNIDVNESQMTSDTRILVDCLMKEGKNCTADQLMPVGGPFGGLEQSYVGILRSFSADKSLRTLNPRYQAPIERFVWNWLAGTTPTTMDSSSHLQISQPCSPHNASSCPPHTICGGVAASDGLVRCVENPPIFVPAFSEAFFHNTTEGRWKVHDNVSENDPMWTESNWPSGTPDLTIYLSESRVTETRVFVAGVTCTSLVLAAALTAQVLWDRRSKID